MQHIHDLIRIAGAPERFFRLAKQRAACRQGATFSAIATASRNAASMISCLSPFRFAATART
jgi:hypothetical protein